MPFKPDKIYKNNGWISWPSFLGKKREIFNVNWLKIDLAKKFIQKFNIKSLSAYQRFVLENKNKFPEYGSNLGEKYNRLNQLIKGNLDNITVFYDENNDQLFQIDHNEENSRSSGL